MALIVRSVHRRIDFLGALAALIDKKLRERKPLALPRMRIQADERKLDLGMSARREARIPLHIKPIVDIFRVLFHDGEQFAVHAARVERDRRLDEVSRAVQLVLGALRENFVGLVHLIIAVEIAARKLGAGNGIHRFIDDGADLGVGIVLLQISGGFQPFCHVRIVKNMGRILPPDAGNGGEAPRLRKPAIHVFERYRRIARAHFLPESVRQSDAIIIDKFHDHYPFNRCVFIITKADGNVNPRPHFHERFLFRRAFRAGTRPPCIRPYRQCAAYRRRYISDRCTPLSAHTPARGFRSRRALPADAR